MMKRRFLRSSSLSKETEALLKFTRKRVQSQIENNYVTDRLLARRIGFQAQKWLWTAQTGARGRSGEQVVQHVP
jgi:hypothetical protein